MGIHPGIQEGISKLAFLFVRQDMTYPGVFISPYNKTRSAREQEERIREWGGILLDDIRTALIPDIL